MFHEPPSPRVRFGRSTQFFVSVVPPCGHVIAGSCLSVVIPVIHSQFHWTTWCHRTCCIRRESAVFFVTLTPLWLFKEVLPSVFEVCWMHDSVPHMCNAAIHFLFFDAGVDRTCTLGLICNPSNQRLACSNSHECCLGRMICATCGSCSLGAFFMATVT